MVDHSHSKLVMFLYSYGLTKIKKERYLQIVIGTLNSTSIETGTPRQRMGSDRPPDRDKASARHEKIAALG